MKQDSMQDDKMMHEGNVKTLFIGKFHGKVHKSEGRVTFYQGTDGKLVRRLTNFKTSNGPDVHVILVAPAMDDANFLKNDTERVELGKLKGNEGDQNYDLPAAVNLNKYQAVAILLRKVPRNFWSRKAGEVLGAQCAESKGCSRKSGLGRPPWLDFLHHKSREGG